MLAAMSALLGIAVPVMPNRCDAPVRSDEERWSNCPILIAALNGDDLVDGDVVLTATTGVDQNLTGAVAAAGADHRDVEVFRQPRVQILSTGDELERPGAALERSDAIPESVSFGVAALAAEWGGLCSPPVHLRDDLASMRKAAAAALDGADVIVVSGGASIGERDFAKSMYEPLGLDLIFSKISMKPGKPVWLGRASDRLIVGLPGNPTSAIVTARLLLAPLLAGLSGGSIDRALSWRAVPLGTPLGPCGPRGLKRARRINLSLRRIVP